MFAVGLWTSQSTQTGERGGARPRTLRLGTLSAAGREVRRRRRRMEAMRLVARVRRKRRNARTGAGRGMRTMRGRRSGSGSATNVPDSSPLSTFSWTRKTSSAISWSRRATCTQRSVTSMSSPGARNARSGSRAMHAFVSASAFAARASRAEASTNWPDAWCRPRDARMGVRSAQRSQAAPVRRAESISPTHASRARCARRSGRTHASRRLP